MTSCQSQAYHLYKEQQRGGLRPGWTDLPKGFVLHHVMYMLSVWPVRTGKRAREAREAVQTSDDEGTLSCAVMLTMSERE